MKASHFLQAGKRVGRWQRDQMPARWQPLSHSVPQLSMTVDSDNSSPPASQSVPPATNETQHITPPKQASLVPTTPVSNRSELLDRARLFLNSPQVIHQDHESKRRFLTEKGLTDGEIQLLLREMVRRVAFPHGLYLARVSSPAVSTPPRAASHVPRATSIPLARPSCGYLQAAFMDYRGLHSPILHLLRASL